MARIAPDCTLREFQDFIGEVYGLPNDRHFSLPDMLSNAERFTMKGLKGVRKNNAQKAKKNILISISWMNSILNRLHIDLESAVWNRFPYLCSYCGACPCRCSEKGIKTRQKVEADSSRKPSTIEGIQKMFSTIYPPGKRSVEHAGIHLAEELGEFSESILAYRGERKNEHFKEIVEESADVFSCFIGVLNSLGISLSDELSSMYNNNCHECHKAPCECSFISIVKYDS